MRLFGEQGNPDTMSPLALAFVGDAVYSLYIREMLASDKNRPVGQLHKLSVEWVNAAAQAKGMKAILPLLTEAEQDVFRRGRNAHPGHTPKNQSACDYHYATGFEALCGYLYLKEEVERLTSLLSEVIKSFGDETGADKA